MVASSSEKEDVILGGTIQYSPDVFDSEYWEDNQQNTDSCRARESMLPAFDGCGWLKIEGGGFFHAKILSFRGS